MGRPSLLQPGTSPPAPAPIAPTSRQRYRHSPLVHDTAGELRMYIHYGIGPLVSLIAGILILVMPRLLNYIVAIYLILIGIVGLLAHGGTAV